MEPPTKKRRGEWTESQLKLAINAVNTGQMSQRKAAAVYSLPRRTLRNHLKSGSTKKNTGRTPILNKSQEKDLCKRIIRLAEIGLPLTPKMVRKQAYEFCKSNNIQNLFNDKKNIAGKKWLKNFIARNPEISLRRAQFMNPARAQKLNKPIVQKHFEAVKKIYDELDICNHPERLYNMDEKGCRLTLHHQQKVFAEKGTKRVHFIAQEHAENVTIAMCVNAIGNTVPPMILFKGKRLKPEFCDNLPPGSLVKMAPKGSMTTELFVEFIKHLGQNKSPGKCLLIFDGASSHLDARIVDAADSQDIVLYCLPSNTTHELQPLDKSVNKSYEHFWDEEVLLYAYQHPERKLTKARFNKIFTKVWSKCTTKDNIINGFRATGIFPYDPKAIAEEAYAPSVLTQLPDSRLVNVSRTMPSDVSIPRPSNLDRHVTLRPTCGYSSDTNSTVCDDDLRSFSPSILIQSEPNFEENYSDELHYVEDNSQPSTNNRKLVDYSTSSECSDVDEIQKPQKQTILEVDNKNAEFYSPGPSTSGNNTQYRQRLLSATPSGSEEEEDFYLQYFQHSSKRINIYTSSSESDEENLNPKLPVITPPNQKEFQIGDSEDDLPLSEMKLTAEAASSKSPFHKQIPTPNFAIIKDNKPRRKALNYIGQKITKDLFDTAKDKKVPKSGDDDENRGQQIPIHKSKKNKDNKKNGDKKFANRQNKIIKEKKPKKICNLKKTKKVGWYCHACKIDRIADMRQCKVCQNWYHEECVGLTKKDLEEFMCPNCG